MKVPNTIVVFFLSLVGIGFIASISTVGPVLNNFGNKSSFETKVYEDNQNNYHPININSEQKFPASPFSALESNNFSDPLWNTEFPVEESCEKMYVGQQVNPDEIELDVPLSYQKAHVRLNCTVENSTIKETVIENSSSLSYSRVRQAQAFFIPQKSNLTQISLYGGTPEKKDVSSSFRILNTSYDGPVLYEFSHLIVDGWNTIEFSSPLQLHPGKYFLWSEKISSCAERAWCRSDIGDNDTESYYFYEDDDDSEWVSADFDLSLKIYTKEIITPTEISLQLNGNSPLYEVDGRAFYEFNCSTSSNEIEIEIGYLSESDIILRYYANLTFFRYGNCSIANIVRLSDEVLLWDLSVDTASPSSSFTDYQAQMGGFKPDHTNFLLYNGTKEVEYYMPDSSSLVVEDDIDLIHFRSPNKLQVLSINENFNQGDTLAVEGFTSEEGWVKITVYSDTQIIFENSALILDTYEFSWKSPESLDSTSVDVRLQYFSPNQYGLYEKSYSYQRYSQFQAQPHTFSALEPIQIKCEFFDAFTQAPIDGASVAFNFKGKKGNFTQTEDGSFICSIAGEIDAIEPGNYSMKVLATKEGYDSINAQIPVSIKPRTAILQYGPKKIKTKSGDKVDLSISLRDEFSQSPLLTPVDLKVSLMRENTQYHQFYAYNLTKDHTLRWKIPEGIQEGVYSIKLEVVDPYYYGDLEIEGGFSVKPSVPLHLLLPSVIISLFISIAVGVRLKKESVKKTIQGVILMHEHGLPMAELIHGEELVKDPILVSGGISGIMGMFKQVTGHRVHTIGMDDGYVGIYNGEGYKIILFLKKNPWWIRTNMENFAESIFSKYGEYITAFQGKMKEINLTSPIIRFFGRKSEIMRALCEQANGKNDEPDSLYRYMTKKDFKYFKIKHPKSKEKKKNPPAPKK